VLASTHRSVLLNDSDAEGDALTATLVAGVQHGTLDWLGNGTFTYTPAAGYAGPDSFRYEAFDGLWYGTQATVTITVSNLAPTVQNVAYTVPADGETQIPAARGVLAGATDPYHFTLTASLVADSGPHPGWLTLNG